MDKNRIAVIARNLLRIATFLFLDSNSDEVKEAKKHIADMNVAKDVAQQGGKWNSVSQRFDFPDDLEIHDTYVKNGKLIVPIGTVGGDLKCGYLELESLEGLPDKQSVAGTIKGEINAMSADHAIENQILESPNNNFYSPTYLMKHEHNMMWLYKPLKGLLDKKALDWNGDKRKWYVDKPIDKKILQKLVRDDGTFYIRLGDAKCDCDFSGIGLTTLNGCPPKVIGNFNCSGNRIGSLHLGPNNIGKSFNCSNNVLRSLVGMPTTIGGGIDCSGNRLGSLEGCNATVNGTFNCSGNPLSSFTGAPKSVAGDFICENCGNGADGSALDGLSCSSFRCSSDLSLNGAVVNAKSYYIDGVRVADLSSLSRKEPNEVDEIREEVVEDAVERSDEEALKQMYDAKEVNDARLKEIAKEAISVGNASSENFAMYIISELLGYQKIYGEQTLVNFFIDHGGVIRSDEPGSIEFSKDNVDAMVSRTYFPCPSALLYALEKGFIDADKFKENSDRYSQMIVNWINKGKVGAGELKSLMDEIKTTFSFMSDKIVMDIIRKELRLNQEFGIQLLVNAGYDGMLKKIGEEKANDCIKENQCATRYVSVLKIADHVPLDNICDFLKNLLIEVADTQTHVSVAEGGDRMNNKRFGPMFEIINHDAIRNIESADDRNELFGMAVTLLIDNATHGKAGAAPISTIRFVLEGYRLGFELVGEYSQCLDTVLEKSKGYWRKSLGDILAYMVFYLKNGGNEENVVKILKEWSSEGRKEKNGALFPMLGSMRDIGNGTVTVSGKPAAADLHMVFDLADRNGINLGYNGTSQG